LELKRINSTKKQRQGSVTVSDRTLPSVAPARPVRAGTQPRAREGGPEAGLAGPARQVTFWRNADAGDQTLAEHYSASGLADVAALWRVKCREGETGR
jgi:hypothetical protein